jgi:hypothetical protein
VISDPNEVQRRRHEDDSVGTLDCRLQHRWKKLVREVREPFIQLVLGARTVELNEVLCIDVRLLMATRVAIYKPDRDPRVLAPVPSAVSYALYLPSSSETD